MRINPLRTSGLIVFIVSLLALWGCSHTVVVPVAPRMDLRSFGPIGIVEFASNADPALDRYATQQFQDHVQGANPGIPILELGSRAAVLAAIGADQFDADAIIKIGKKYRVNAVFVGDVVYSAPHTDFRVTDLGKLEGRARTEIRGDMSTKLMETQVGASVWSSSAWAKRQIGRISVSTEHGVSASMDDDNPRREMLPALAFHVTEDFRPTYVRRSAE